MVNKLAEEDSDAEFMDQDSDDQNMSSRGDEEIDLVDDGRDQERYSVVFPDSEAEALEEATKMPNDDIEENGLDLHNDLAD